VPTLTQVGIGSVLDGRYRLDALIAEGGFGVVYRATHLPTGCDVAIKVLRPSFATRSSMAARFVREGELLAQLRHPNTVSTYELGVAGETMYIAMELLRGETLHERLTRTGAFDWVHAVTIAQGLCAALAEAHSLGIVHRDLKPSNIHLEPWAGGELVKVIDFGVAKLLRTNTLSLTGDDELTYFGQVLGTPEYMAPEQLVGELVDHRADIYALGVVLYEMLAAKRPFDVGGNTAMLLMQIAQYAPNRPSLVVRYAGGGIARELDRVVLKCLAADPDDRFQSIDELVRALDAILASARIPTMPAEPTLTSVRPRRFAMGTSVPLPAVEAADEPSDGPLEDQLDDADMGDRTGRVMRRSGLRLPRPTFTTAMSWTRSQS
jgi:serine/threonine-protein kinase